MWENYLSEYFKLVLLSLKKRGRVWRSVKNEVCGHPNQYPWYLNKKSKLTELKMNSSSGPFSIKFILLLGFSWWFAVNIFIASIDPLPKRGRHPLLAGMISSLQSFSKWAVGWEGMPTHPAHSAASGFLLTWAWSHAAGPRNKQHLIVLDHGSVSWWV